MAELTQTEMQYRETRDAIKNGKIVVITSGGKREFVNEVTTITDRRDRTKDYFAKTLAGYIQFDSKVSIAIFDSNKIHEAQHFLFRQTEKMAA